MEVIQKSSGLTRKQVNDRLYLAHKENDIPMYVWSMPIIFVGAKRIPSFHKLDQKERHKIVYGYFAGGSPRVRRKNGIEPLPDWEKPVTCVMSYHPDKQFEIFDALISGSEIAKDMPAKMAKNLLQPFVRDFVEGNDIGKSLEYLGMTSQDRLRKTIETASKYEEPLLAKVVTYCISGFDGFEEPTEKPMSYKRKNDNEFYEYCSWLEGDTIIHLVKLLDGNMNIMEIKKYINDIIKA